MKPKWITAYLDNGGTMNDLKVTSGSDDLFSQALSTIIREQKANVRLLKAELNVGTTKALELMDKLEQAGKVSACDERGGRKVLVTA